MQSQDGKERQDAEQKLDEMRRNAPDEAARQAAEALQKQHQQRAENQTEGVKSGTNTDGNPNVVKDKPPAPAMTPDKQHGERASSLTLQSFEQFKKNLTKEMMNDAQITEQDLKDLEALLRRRAAERPEPEKLTGPQRGATLPAQDVRQVQSATQQSSNAQRGGPALPPPELREGQNEFTKKLSEKQRTRDKN
jgi:hypothetical protein